MSEPFSWTKFFSGLVDPTAYWKTFAILIRVTLIALFLIGVVFLGLRIREIFHPKKETSTVIISGQNGGEVHNTKDDRKQEWSLFRLW